MKASLFLALAPLLWLIGCAEKKEPSEQKNQSSTYNSPLTGDDRTAVAQETTIKVPSLKQSISKITIYNDADLAALRSNQPNQAEQIKVSAEDIHDGVLTVVTKRLFLNQGYRIDLSGSDGCNTSSASAQGIVIDEMIELKNLNFASTMMACAPAKDKSQRFATLADDSSASPAGYDAWGDPAKCIDFNMMCKRDPSPQDVLKEGCPASGGTLTACGCGAVLCSIPVNVMSGG